MPSQDQLTELSNPEILNAFLADIKTSEIQSKLDAINQQKIVSLKEKTAEFERALKAAQNAK